MKDFKPPLSGYAHIYRGRLMVKEKRAIDRNIAADRRQMQQDAQVKRGLR